MAIFGPHSFSGGPITYDGFTVFPGGMDPFGSDVVGAHYAAWQADLLITLCDPFMLDAAAFRPLNVAHWVPVDCDRLGAVDRTKLSESGGAVIAMSRFGERRLREAQFSPHYAPHSIPTDVFKPLADREAVRTGMGLQPGDFAVAINAANKAGPRKAYPEQMAAFAEFHRRHPEAKLLIHALIEPKDGVNLRAIAASLDITEACFFGDQYAYLTGQTTAEAIAAWSGAADVGLNGTFGEGFGVPVVEFQACGTPVITSAFSSMPELTGAGWKVGGQKHWVPGHDAWWQCPSIAQIDRALEKAWRAREDGAMPALRQKARAFALAYDTQTVFARYWRPILGLLEERRVRPVKGVPVSKPRRDGDAIKRDLLVIVPSRGRPESVKRLVAACADTCTAKTDLVFGFDDDDPALEGNIAAAEAAGTRWESPPWEHGPRKSLTAWTNDLARKYGSGYRALASLGDDHVPRTPGWDSALLAAIDGMGGTGFAYPNDLVRDDIPEAVVMSSDIVETLGWMANPETSHWFVDNCWADLGKNAGCIAYLPDVIVEHANAASGKAPGDQTNYDSARSFAADQDAYGHWRTERMRGDVATLRALRAYKGKPSFAVDYAQRAGVWSDTQEHLAFLNLTARKYQGVRVLELGTRCGFSTSAFLAAVEKNGGHVWSVDKDPARVPAWWHGHKLWTFTQADDLEWEPPDTLFDVIFLDTSHTLEHTRAELERFVPLAAPGGVVLVHDTLMKEPHNGSGDPPYPVAKALDEYCAKAGLSWAERGGVYGLGVIDIPAAKEA